MGEKRPSELSPFPHDSLWAKDTPNVHPDLSPSKPPRSSQPAESALPPTHSNVFCSNQPPPQNRSDLQPAMHVSQATIYVKIKIIRRLIIFNLKVCLLNCTSQLELANAFVQRMWLGMGRTHPGTFTIAGGEAERLAWGYCFQHAPSRSFCPIPSCQAMSGIPFFILLPLRRVETRDKTLLSASIAEITAVPFSKYSGLPGTFFSVSHHLTQAKHAQARLGICRKGKGLATGKPEAGTSLLCGRRSLGTFWPAFGYPQKTS